MKLLSPKLSDLQLNRAEIFRNLGYGDSLPDEQITEMIEYIILHATKICRPNAGYIIQEGKLIDQKFLEINEVSITIGPVISRYFQHATQFACFVATAGIEFDSYLQQLRAEGDIVNEFLADAIGSEIAEATVRFVSARIAEDADSLGLTATRYYSPGYCSWHVREQEKFFSLFPNNPCDIILNDSNLMFPVKSVSGVVGLGNNIEITPHSCDICGLKTCYKRKN